jgi:maltose O-acetyltransferase
MTQSRPRQSVVDYALSQRAGFHPRLLLAQLVLRLIPLSLFPHFQALIYRWAGFDIGSGTRILGPFIIRGWGDIYRNLSIGPGSAINSHVDLDLSAPVRLGANCTLGHYVVFITTNHEMGPSTKRGGPPAMAGITVGDGAWIGACVTILPGVTIGPGAFVAAGSIVTRSIPANGRAAGNPAVVKRIMDEDAPAQRRPASVTTTPA